MKLTSFGGHLTMYRFLDQCWRVFTLQSPSKETEELAGLLGDVSPFVFTDRTPADPAAWEDWVDCVKSTVPTENELTEQDAFNCMVTFLTMYHEEFGFGFLHIIEELKQLKESPNGTIVSWTDWLDCANKVLQDNPMHRI